MSKRVNYGRLPDVIDIPDLISVQLDSFFECLQSGADTEKRTNTGLQEAFTEVFPIESFDKNCLLNFVSYELGIPKKPMIDCLKDGETYSVPLHVTFRLENKAAADAKGEIIEDRVYMGDIPMMTDRATFVINGAERVIISQLHRTPGICFESSKSTQGRTLYSYRIIPDRGSWMEVQYDNSDLMYIYLDRRRRRRKFLVSTFLRALAYETNHELLDVIYGIEKESISALAKKDNLSDLYAVEDTLNEEGDIVAKGLEPLSPVILDALKDMGVKKLEFVDTKALGNTFILALERDPSTDADDALKTIYKKMRPGDPPSTANAKQLLKRLFFDLKHYDLGYVGRYKINQKLKISVDPNERTLQPDDIVASTKYVMKLKTTKGRIDDIDHLGSRRVRTVGELVQNQVRVGLARTERLIRERMTLFDMESDTMTPAKLINPKALQSVVRDFFGRSQLSQFMDQTNPLAELTAKRRLSALGPGGLSRERAGFEVRDVHSSHYGRICPIETPEGPNIGLISSLAIFGKVNSYGFIETPYRKVIDGKVTDEIEYVTADSEEEFVIAQANAELNDDRQFTQQFVLSRNEGDSGDAESDTITHMDVSPKQLVSPATSCIPFLEHDDANRALMGSNMQRQAVPLLCAEAPLVGTGMEATVAKDSRAVVCSKLDGVIASANSTRIIVTKDGTLPADEEDLDPENIYDLYKFMRSNSSTCMNQKPIVKAGDTVKAGDVIADGFATQGGELALGRNVLVAFMPWCGYNFEDAIIISERIVHDDVYTSIHIAEANIQARDTKLGPEEITRDTPNVGEEALRNLGPEGVIRLGAEVKPGDILVGKITPKSETELAPEERLLRAIFGDKAADVKDSSLYTPSGVSGVVMDIRIERKIDPTKVSVSKADIKRQVKEANNNYKVQYQEFLDDLADKLGSILLGSKLPVDIVSEEDNGSTVVIPANRKITKVLLRKLASHHDTYSLPDGPAKDQIDEVMKSFNLRLKDIKLRHQESIEQLESSEGKDPGVIKGVKVYIAAKRKLSVGDKMAGRHGNKGIVSNIVPICDLPFQQDGTAVDIILNPLGVPSRMNVGQILETHLGWAAKKLGYNIASPVFDGVPEGRIQDLLKEAGLPEDGKAELFDGRTGERFAQRVTVGQIYMLKLDHLVVNKIHARAVGPYSLVTQQPLGGKAQHGGQRFGEMEVWALEAYGAAYTLQEMLTVKSDDVVGRTKIYESIVRGDNTLVAGIPESFNVLMKEMQSLCLDVRVKRG
ncbi:MAG: DNA-directed RNA polymerase subunit beta [Lentisphaeraceae bacterium]|nr:DNA-directed RNA polymerase subunit beta [Lentisphaeraceae bacterium]